MIKRGFSIGKLICYIVLIIWAVITIYPLIYTFLTSFKTQTSMYTNMFGLPETWHFENYAALFADMGFGKSIFNSFFITITTVVCQLVISCMVSFVITQIRFKSSNKVLGLFVIGMLIPAQVLIIPISIMAKYMDGYNNLPFLICVYIATGMPYMIFVICGFMKNLPKELMEAGLIDGCNGLKTFTKIVVPLSRPAIATMGMLSFIGTWNEMIIALILLKKNELKTVSLALNMFAGDRFSNFPGMCAAVMIGVLPTMLIYFIFQENIIAGMTAGAVKG